MKICHSRPICATIKTPAHFLPASTSEATEWLLAREDLGFLNPHKKPKDRLVPVLPNFHIPYYLRLTVRAGQPADFLLRRRQPVGPADEQVATVDLH